jgi:hypothetical protein
MSISIEFLSGVVEGFYGRCWSLDTRLAYADYLVQGGLNTYIYCPKSDPYLRWNWQEDWPDSLWKELLQLSTAYKQRNINWGVGLSPVELYREYGSLQREQLRRKVKRIGELGAPLLAILFDDMPGELDFLATRQAEIVADVCDWLPGVHMLVCPTYYSFDPVLERYFGKMPKDYWPQLGRELPAHTKIFWTGNKVCSESIGADDVKQIAQLLGRPVILWDNYPVNDGAERCNFLYTSKLSARAPDLQPVINGHLCNPMNQGLLSLPALSGLATLHGNGGLNDEVLCQILGPLTWERLTRDKHSFEHEGLIGMGEARRHRLATEYGKLPGPAAQEVAQWLRGEYRFDPSCLTG